MRKKQNKFRISFRKEMIKIVHFNICDEFKNVMPDLTREEYQQLEESLLNNGYMSSNPIIVWDGYIVDGHKRYEICQRNNIVFNYVELDKEKFNLKIEVIKYIIDIHFCRRHLSNAQKISIIYKYKDLIAEWNKERQRSGNILGGENKQKNINLIRSNRDRDTNTREQLAKLAGVSTGTIARYETVLKTNSETLINRMMSGEESINSVYKKATARKPIPKKIQKIKTQESNGTCEICGCNIFPILEFHHIKMVCEGGNNDYDNIKLICPNCHSLIHILEDTKDIKARQSLIESLRNTQYEKLLELYH